MKRINNLYEKLISDENLYLAIITVNNSHRWLPKHRLNKVVAWVEQDIPARICELRKIIDNGFTPKPIKTKTIWDKSACKWRNISEPALYPDQYIHHAFIQVLEPIFMRGMDKYCCGSIKGRGIHYGMTALKKWMKNDRKGTKYCLEMDIRHFYDTLKPKIVIDRLKHLIKDYKVIDLAERIMRDGVLIGVYCSQWFANTILQPLDMLIRQSGLGVSHYLRYMDNFTIFSPNKRKLRKLFKIIENWLKKHGLSVKGNWQIYPVAHRLPTALGYRYGRGYTLLRKRNLLRLKRQLSKCCKKLKKGKKISIKLAYGLLSRLGQLTHCNHRFIYNDYYYPKLQGELKQIIRRHQHGIYIWA